MLHCLLETAQCMKAEGKCEYQIALKLERKKDLSWLEISIDRALQNYGDIQLQAFLFA